MDKIYEPQDDSFMLAEQVKKFAFGSVLDVGTGTGIQAITAAKNKKVKNVVAVDIDKKALDEAGKNAEKEKLKTSIKFIHSDLFKKIKSKKKEFDTIIFNPPYLPDDTEFIDRGVHGGKKGYETLELFLSQANDYLSENGLILIVFSSLTKKDKVDEAIESYGFEKKQLSEKRVFFEMLYVYSIKKTALLRELNKRGLKEIKKFAKGHRGIIYAALLKNKKAAIKTKRPDSKAVGRMHNEAVWLKKLNKEGIGARFLFEGKEFFVYEFVDGNFIMDYFKKNKKEKIIRVIKDLFRQCFILDNLKINKEEMHHPFKHVIINNKNRKTILVDFERMHKTKKPHNVTQLCQFWMNKQMKRLLNDKGIKFNDKALITAAKNYREKINKENLQKIISIIKK